MVGNRQGSVIGPLLFTIYVNDITIIKSQDVKCNITTYADDTNLLVTAASITDVVNKPNLLMVEAGNWFLKNKLILNSTKINIMLFKTNRGITDKPQKVSINSNEFGLKESAKFLGVVLENTLCWAGTDMWITLRRN